MYFDFNKERFEQEIVDTDRYFRLVYSPTLKTYLMMCCVFWIASYDRVYVITKEDYDLYQLDKDLFYQRFDKEIKQGRDCFTSRFAGACALRDYDGMNGFQHAFPLPNEATNAFQHHVYIDKVFYAEIKWRDAEILVPPVQAVADGNNGFYFPLREKCEYQTNSEGRPICYKLKKEYINKA